MAARFGQDERGQTLLMFVLFMIVLFVFIGLGVDLGFSYITQARLSKAVDSACLTGMRNLYQGEAQASTIASNAFLTNYGTSGRDVAPPALSISFSNFNNNAVVNVSATVSINTYFIRVLPQWAMLTVGSSGQATRPDVIMTLVLDHSYSMDPVNGTTKGGGVLPAAVASFINNFDDAYDQVSMVSFGSTVTNNVPMTAPFKSLITTAANNLIWAGGTCSPCGLTNALVTENAVTPPSSEKTAKVVVFFTDGYCNMVQSTFNCPGQTPAGLTPLNIGGFDTGSGGDAFLTNTPATYQGQEWGAICSFSDNGNLGGTSCGCNGSQFYSYANGSMENLTRANITTESEYRCIWLANQMRTNNTYVYSIGLGGDPNAPPTLTFLQQVANDPSVPGYVPTQYDGEAVLAPTTSQLEAAFQQIASDILLRLSK